MKPLGFNRIQPGTLDREEAGDDSATQAGEHHLASVVREPGVYFSADMPGSVISAKNVSTDKAAWPKQADQIGVPSGNSRSRPFELDRLRFAPDPEPRSLLEVAGVELSRVPPIHGSMDVGS